MAREYDSLRRQLKTSVSTVVSWVSEKNTWSLARFKFVSCLGKQVWIAQAAEHAEMRVLSFLVKQLRVWHLIRNRTGWQNVEDMRCSV